MSFHSPQNELYRAACTARVEEAKARLTLREVWDLAPCASQSLCPQNGLGVVRSPLREDRTPSFSIFSGGKAFSDKARSEVKGGVWEFVAFAQPGMPPKEIARLLVERAGLQWPDLAAFTGAAKKADDETDEAKAARLREERLKQERAERAQRDNAERERRALRDGKGGRVLPVPAWPACVAERWKEGGDYRDKTAKVMAALCEKRGWPVDWVDMLCAWDVMAFPLEARYEVGEKGAKRMVAFRVQAPVMGGGQGGAGTKLLDVGYHQKFFNQQENRSGWRFLPSRPKKAAGACSLFERGMLAAAEARGAKEGESMLPPLPFVVGCVERPRLVIILEGQWDAITMMGALNGFNVDGYGPRDVACFGVRGVNGTRVLLDHWGQWLRAVKPLVWLLPDNDAEKTGGAWYPPGKAADRRPGVLYFSERLAWLGARRVVVTPLRGGSGGKDFNDYYRLAKPDVEVMGRWMEKLKLL